MRSPVGVLVARRTLAAPWLLSGGLAAEAAARFTCVMHGARGDDGPGYAGHPVAIDAAARSGGTVHVPAGHYVRAPSPAELRTLRLDHEASLVAA